MPKDSKDVSAFGKFPQVKSKNLWPVSLLHVGGLVVMLEGRRTVYK